MQKYRRHRRPRHVMRDAALLGATMLTLSMIVVFTIWTIGVQ